MSFSFQKLRIVFIPSFEMGHHAPRNADLGFLMAMTWRWDQLPSKCHQNPLCAREETEGSLGCTGREDGTGGVVDRIQNLLSGREDPWSTAAPSWMWVVRDIPDSQVGMGW